ncbi:MAG TPA: hypothetical protein VNX68_07750, partial [Nitrosopumilaceae archaeon]|nr:hypothetical protein [Nitrosopumilaceae archaeon]
MKINLPLGKFFAMRKFVYLFLLTPWIFNAQSVDTVALRFSKSITANDLKTHLSILASDEYEGRETGQKGQKMAAEYILKHFSSCGIPPLTQLDKGYFQSFPLAVYQPEQINITVH